MLNRAIGLALVAAALGGCAGVPETIRTPAPGPDVREARADPDAHTGSVVRWGGTISGIQNLENRTIITVVARRLSGRGEPQSDSASIGRFLAEADRFLEPQEYQSGRRITVVGRFTGIREDRIDQYVYEYPVVQVNNLYLWEEYTRYREPDPFWDWPYRYPYWHYPYSWRHRHFHPWLY